MQTDTQTLIDFIVNFKGNEDGYTLGQLAAQQAFPFIQPVPFPESENKKDRQKNMVNGYLGAGYANAIDTLAPQIISLLQQKKEIEVSNWISAHAKPECNIGVLVFIPEEDNHITSGMWDVSEKWVLLDEYRVPESEVTHWMPLPAVPIGYEIEPLPPEMEKALKDYANNYFKANPDKLPGAHVRSQLSAKDKDEWISVFSSAHQPEIGKYYLVNVGQDTVLKGRLMNNGWTAFFADGEKLVGEERFVTHYKEMPEPPDNPENMFS